jgi:hypothetical protein
MQYTHYICGINEWLMFKSIHLIIILLLCSAFISAQSNIPANNHLQEQIKMIEDIKVFPNPAVDYIQISNGSFVVKKIVILNIFSKEVKSFQHYNNAQHDISELKPGLYIIRMVDEKNKVIRSLKFNKTYDGA